MTRAPLKKLTDKMCAHLVAVAGGERCAYPNLSIGTLRALESRGLVAASYGHGSMWSPATGIRWRLTADGRRVVEKGEL